MPFYIILLLSFILYSTMSFILYQHNSKSDSNNDEVNEIFNKIKPTSISPSTIYYDIESDLSDYVESDDDLVEMISEEKHDTKYLANFQNSSEEFDEHIMIVDSVNEL